MLYFKELVQVESLALNVRDFQLAALKLPKLGNLVQEVELDSGLCLNENNGNI